MAEIPKGVVRAIEGMLAISVLTGCAEMVNAGTEEVNKEAGNNGQTTWPTARPQNTAEFDPQIRLDPTRTPRPTETPIKIPTEIPIGAPGEPSGFKDLVLASGNLAIGEKAFREANKGYKLAGGGDQKVREFLEVDANKKVRFAGSAVDPQVMDGIFGIEQTKSGLSEGKYGRLKVKRVGLYIYEGRDSQGNVAGYFLNLAQGESGIKAVAEDEAGALWEAWVDPKTNQMIEKNPLFVSWDEIAKRENFNRQLIGDKPITRVEFELPGRGQDLTGRLVVWTENSITAQRFLKGTSEKAVSAFIPPEYHIATNGYVTYNTGAKDQAGKAITAQLEIPLDIGLHKSIIDKVPQIQWGDQEQIDGLAKMFLEMCRGRYNREHKTSYGWDDYLKLAAEGKGGFTQYGTDEFTAKDAYYRSSWTVNPKDGLAMVYTWKQLLPYGWNGKGSESWNFYIARGGSGFTTVMDPFVGETGDYHLYLSDITRDTSWTTNGLNALRLDSSDCVQIGGFVPKCKFGPEQSLYKYWRNLQNSKNPLVTVR